MASPAKKKSTRVTSWHEMTGEEVTAMLAADPVVGLAERESARRREEYGPNQLATSRRTPWWQMILAQFQDFMVLVLLAATAISYAMGEVADSVTILVIIVINAILGFVQEYRAEQSLEALKQLTAPTARVRRDGQETQVAAADLVPGDMLLLEAGDKVPADSRLLDGTGLEAEEAALTGESLPVRKNPSWVGSDDTTLGDRRNLLYMGTTITRGRGLAVVVTTGMSTEMGRIAGMIQEVEEEETPLQIRLRQLGKWLVLGCLLVCALVVGVGLLEHDLTPPEITRLFLAGVSLAVAAIPEGLPAIVTVALALGVQRMIKRNAIVRKLQAVETLGCATVICSDKTGTLTKNEMMVRAAWAGNRFYEVTGDGYRVTGEFRADGHAIRPLEEPALAQMLFSAALCSNAHLVTETGGRRPLKLGGAARHKGYSIQGDPTEGALMVAAAKAGYKPEKLHQNYERLVEIPFESERRRMSVINRTDGGGLTLHLKGAPDTVLELSTHILTGGEVRPLTPALRQTILAQNEAMAAGALRVLAVAYRPLPADAALWLRGSEIHPDQTSATWEREMVFLGLVGMIDPPRPEVKRAVQAASRAGIRTVMITGDHPATAAAVARELGISGSEGGTLTGRELDGLSDSELLEQIGSVRVFARVSPQHKLRIVRAFKALGEIVAMTGDGVNDAPAVKEADIGIAMGRSGTDVTKEASAMVLSDDNYATIVAAVEEGRGIYDNIRKFIRYLLSCNTGEVLTMFLAAVMQLPLPLLPIQILFVNLVTDGLPAMALGVDPREPDVMRRPPRRPDEGIFARRLGVKILGRGVLIGVATLGAFLWAVWTARQVGINPFADPDNLARARTMALATLVSAQLIHVFDCRSERRSIFETNLFSNMWLVGAVGSSVAALLAAIYWAPLSTVFNTTSLGLTEWVVILLLAGMGEILVAVRRFILYGRPVRLSHAREEA